MNKKIVEVQIMTTIFAGLITRDLVIAVAVAFGMTVFDCFTGVLAAFINGEFKSSIMRKGFKSKLMFIAALMFGVWVNISMSLVNFGISIPVGQGIAMYIIFMETCSNIENINHGMPGLIPDYIVRAFNTARDEKKEE